jgi:hypothetical protein
VAAFKSELFRLTYDFLQEDLIPDYDPERPTEDDPVFPEQPSNDTNSKQGQGEEEDSDEEEKEEQKEDVKMNEVQPSAAEIVAMQEEADQLTEWLATEQQLDQSNWLPARTTTENIDEQDPEAVVLFDGTNSIPQRIYVN